MDVDIPDIEQGQQDNHVDRILLPVPAAIYNNRMEILQCAGRLKWELAQLVTLFEGRPFDPLIFAEEEVAKVNAKEISGRKSLQEKATLN